MKRIFISDQFLLQTHQRFLVPAIGARFYFNTLVTIPLPWISSLLPFPSSLSRSPSSLLPHLPPFSLFLSLFSFLPSLPSFSFFLHRSVELHFCCYGLFSKSMCKCLNLNSSLDDSKVSVLNHNILECDCKLKPTSGSHCLNAYLLSVIRFCTSHFPF